MMHNSLAIKNLSIALDALGHVRGAEEHFERTKDLLMDEIKVAQKEKHPVIHTLDPNYTQHSDDISF